MSIKPKELRAEQTREIEARSEWPVRSYSVEGQKQAEEDVRALLGHVAALEKINARANDKIVKQNERADLKNVISFPRAAAPKPQTRTCACCGLLHPGEPCDCTGCADCPTTDKFAHDGIDERMRREKLASAIAWLSGDKKPSARRVSRGDLLAMLQELQRFRTAK